jgi:hypothetical protein
MLYANAASMTSCLYVALYALMICGRRSSPSLVPVGDKVGPRRTEDRRGQGRTGEVRRTEEERRGK